MSRTEWLQSLKEKDLVNYTDKNSKKTKTVEVIKHVEICILLSNGDIVDDIDGENLHRSHFISC